MRKAILIVAACLCLTLPAMAGVVFEVETTDHESSPPKVDTTEVYAEGKNLKMSISAGSGRGQDGKMIYHGDRRRVVVVDDSSRSYQMFDTETLNRVQGQMGGRADDQMAIARKELEKRMGNLTAEQRKALEQALGHPKGGAAGIFGQAPAPLEVRRTGQRAKKHGYPCVKYEVFQGGQKIRELWITDWSHIDGGREAAAAFKDMASFFGEMIDKGFGGEEFNEYALLFDQGGFPVVVKEFENDELTSESFLRSSSRRELDPADFEPPSGYKRQEMFGGR